MRTPKEDIALIGEAGVWKGERDPLLNSVGLLLMYAKRRHRPVRNLHNLAEALERGDERDAQKWYERLASEVDATLGKYPDIVGTVNQMAQMSDEEMAEIDRLMQQVEPD